MLVRLAPFLSTAANRKADTVIARNHFTNKLEPDSGTNLAEVHQSATPSTHDQETGWDESSFLAEGPQLSLIKANESTSPNPLDSIPPLMAQAVLATLQRLRDAHDSASKFGRDSWDFAIELSQLVDAGISTHVLRLLVCKKWITHQRETTGVGDSRNGRAFDHETELAFSERTCFVITKLGYQFVNHLSNPEIKQLTAGLKDKVMSTHHTKPGNENQSSDLVEVQKNGQLQHVHPIWDRDKRELRVGDKVVKQFKWPAENQERVLDAFQDEGWPPRIDDPLLPHPKICPKRRLHDTLKCLNRKQANELIKFRGDGTGLGVILELNLNEVK